nr:uncharacterized protein LOC129431206 [Misgurnus anguillicaudatus]
MKTSSEKTQKPQKKNRRVGTRKRSTMAYSAYIYKIEKFNSAVCDTVSVMRILTDAHAQVGSEAARLSKFNRKRVITQREVHTAAVRALQEKRA